jgi:hypothetical protein
MYLTKGFAAQHLHYRSVEQNTGLIQAVRDRLEYWRSVYEMAVDAGDEGSASSALRCVLHYETLVKALDTESP